MNEKLKKIFGWSGAIIIALFIYGVCFCLGLLTYNWIRPNRPEIPDNSKEEVIVLVKDSTETKKLRVMVYDLEAKLERYENQLKRKKTFVTTKIKSNERYKLQATSGNDSALSNSLDSVLTRYSVLFEQGGNKNSDSGGF